MEKAQVAPEVVYDLMLPTENKGTVMKKVRIGKLQCSYKPFLLNK